MLIIFNFPGALSLGLGILIAFIIHPAGGTGTILIAGAIMAAFDLIWRVLNKDAYGERSFFGPRRGGNIFFIPSWIIGVVVFLFGLCRFAANLMF